MYWLHPLPYFCPCSLYLFCTAIRLQQVFFDYIVAFVQQYTEWHQLESKTDFQPFSIHVLITHMPTNYSHPLLINAWRATLSVLFHYNCFSVWILKMIITLSQKIWFIYCQGCMYVITIESSGLHGYHDCRQGDYIIINNNNNNSILAQ